MAVNGDGGFILGADAFCFGAGQGAPPGPLPPRHLLRQALYAGGVFAASGRLGLDGYATLDGPTAARLDAMVEGVMAWLAAEDART